MSSKDNRDEAWVISKDDRQLLFTPDFNTSDWSSPPKDASWMFLTVSLGLFWSYCSHIHFTGLFDELLSFGWFGSLVLSACM